MPLVSRTPMPDSSLEDRFETTIPPQLAELDSVNSQVEFELTPKSGWYLTVKPSFEFLLALLLLIPTLPLMFLAWLTVKLASRGPGFYSQTRLGRDNKGYRIHKIRSMHHNIETVSGVQWAAKNDPRVFTLGKWLRKTHLDELPQLFNILRGEMTLVGPRPERPEVIRSKSLCELVPGFALRTLIKPGVTGLAQVQLPPDKDVRGVRYKVAYDLYYIVNQSLWLDIRICLATVFKALGMGPQTLRRIFFLPTADQVVMQFFQLIETPTPGHSSASWQPA